MKTQRIKALVSFLILVAAVGVAAGQTPQDYVAFAVTKSGEHPLPGSLDEIDHAELINVKWGEYSGPTVRVGVLEVDNDSNVNSFQMTGPGGQSYSYSMPGYENQVPVNGIESMLTDVLHRSGRFNLVERAQLEQVLVEQDLATEGRISQPTAAKTGKVLGAKYLIQGVVTSYEPDFKGKKGGFGGFARGLVGGASGGKTKSMIGINFRLIDAETSEIAFTRQVDVIMTKSEFSIGGSSWGMGGGGDAFFSSYSQTPIGQAVMAAINIGAYELVKQIGAAPLEGSVVKIEANRVYVNLGGDQVSVGTSLRAIAKGEELIDPDTGLSLGGEDELLGILDVESVKEKFSIAIPMGFDPSRLQRGDKIVADAAPAELRFAASWAGKTVKGKKKKKK